MTAQEKRVAATTTDDSPSKEDGCKQQQQQQLQQQQTEWNTSPAGEPEKKGAPALSTQSQNNVDSHMVPPPEFPNPSIMGGPMMHMGGGAMRLSGYPLVMVPMTPPPPPPPPQQQQQHGAMAHHMAHGIAMQQAAMMMAAANSRGMSGMVFANNTNPVEVKRSRGRPKKTPLLGSTTNKRPRGRPPKKSSPGAEEAPNVQEKEGENSKQGDNPPTAPAAVEPAEQRQDGERVKDREIPLIVVGEPLPVPLRLLGCLLYSRLPHHPRPHP
jgi:hypothetical protein